MSKRQRYSIDQWIGRAILGLFLAAISTCALADGPTNQTMSTTYDVLGGHTILLPQDDAGVLVTTTNQPPFLLPLDSSNSSLTAQGQVTFPAIPVVGYTSNSVVTSTASGRMYNNGNDVVVTVAAGNSFGTPVWTYTMWDPATRVENPSTVPSQLEPNAGIIFSRVVMGNFGGTLLSQALIFVESDFTKYTLWGMNIVAASDVNTVDSPLTSGTQYSMDVKSTDVAPASEVPIAASIVAGDFDGDGIDEIAALMSDGKTVRIYKVNAQLGITPYSSFTLPHTLSPATLAAGHFGVDTPKIDTPKILINKVSLVAVGQRPGSAQITIDYIDPGATPIAPVESTQSAPTTHTGDTTYYANIPIAGILAQAAPVITPASNQSEQLVVGLQYVRHIPANNGNWDSGFVWFGTFGSADTFNLQGSTDALNEAGCLISMQVGNFNNLSNGTINPALQIALLKNEEGGGGGDTDCSPNYDGGYLHVEVDNINVPADVALHPTNPPSAGIQDWLKEASPSIVPDIGPYDNLQGGGVSLVTGDFQGRSLRLGTPEIVTISQHIQPTLVLGMPPMHVDWVNPSFLNTQTNNYCEPNSQGAGVSQCILNLTVKPYGLSTDRTDAFNSSYLFTDQASEQNSSTNTTSWGLSVKDKTGETVKFADPVDLVPSAKETIALTVANAYNNVSSLYQSSYTGTHGALTTATAFDDHLFYTSETQQIYNYPILGQTDGNGKPLYASFSVPSDVEYGELDGATAEWYQPVHEPGNVLSYPWDPSQFGIEFASGKTTPLASSGCVAVGSSSESTTVGWSAGTSSSSSAGWSDTLSSDLDISASLTLGAMVEDVGGATFKVFSNLDIGGSSSWSSIDQSATTHTTGEALALNIPPFDKGLSSQTAYGFENLIFGAQNPPAPDGSAAQTDGTYQGSLVPPATSTNISTTGPLFVRFLANPLNSDGLTCGAGGNWWGDTYNLPDVGFNHPNRWDVTSSNVATFNNFVKPSQTPIIDQLFYQMKGLYITQQAQAGDTPNVGMTIGEATAGDVITLNARVYNFSLVPTYSDATVHVRFYGQEVCDNGGITDVCNNAFLIRGGGRDGDVVISSIPGFGQPGTPGQKYPPPNWALAQVNFDTAGHGGANLVFWAVTWLEDANGNVLPEMPGHGVKETSFAGQAFNNITDISLDAHSNNVGMYGTNSLFQVVPAPSSSAPGATAPIPLGSLKSISLSLRSPKLLLDRKARVGVTFNSGEGSFGGSPVAYYDGNPAQGGKLFDFQRVPSLAPDSSSSERVFFRPESCGEHTIYAVSSVGGFPATIGQVSAEVTVEPVAMIAGMITYIESITLRPELKDLLVDQLKHAQHEFREGETDRGLAGLKEFSRLLTLFPKQAGDNLQARIDTLTIETKSIITCAPTLRRETTERAAR